MFAQATEPYLKGGTAFRPIRTYKLPSLDSTMVLSTVFAGGPTRILTRDQPVMSRPLYR